MSREDVGAVRGGATARRAASVDVRRAHADTDAGAAMLVDVRTEGEYAGGHAPGALLLPLHRLASSLGELPTDRHVYVICRSGHRSAMAAAQIAAAGRRVSNVQGGMLAWEQAGLPTVRDAPGRRGILSLLRWR